VKRILVISDTHGNQSYLRQVCLSEKYDIIFHLGDDYSDLDHNHDLTDAKQVFRVPGIINEPGNPYTPPLIQHVIIDNWRFQLVHRYDDVECVEPPDEVILFGHTHQPVYHFNHGILYANPGHLKSSHHRNHHASYLMITLDEEQMHLEWKDLNGLIFIRHAVTRADGHY
jgi:predicted phosphodiesterase